MFVYIEATPKDQTVYCNLGNHYSDLYKQSAFPKFFELAKVCYTCALDIALDGKREKQGMIYTNQSNLFLVNFLSA